MLWIDFVNSDARDHLGRGQHEDRLEDPGWVKQFAKKWQLRPLQLRSKADRDRLRRLRSLLTRWVESIVHREPVPPRDIQALNRYLTAQPVRPQLRADGGSFSLDLIPGAAGVEAWLFAVAASFAEFLVDEDPTRLKTCDNADCCWVFYDTTRSRTRRWCAVGCGDLIKVREFRQRQKRKQR
jgi:predicted RNA-binding Zn ribbon-like protein